MGGNSTALGDRVRPRLTSTFVIARTTSNAEEALVAFLWCWYGYDFVHARFVVGLRLVPGIVFVARAPLRAMSV